jgi:hypothetical protein
MAFFELSCSFQSKGGAFLLSGVIVECHFVLDKLDCRVDFVEIVGRKELQFLELVDDLNPVREVLVLRLLLLLLLLRLLLRRLLV